MTVRNILITDVDRRRLGTLIERAANIGLADRNYIEDLEEELERAIAVDFEEVPREVITMNSIMQLRDLDTGVVESYKLVYPDEANAAENLISVLAPIGIAIIGYRVGDVIKWPASSGIVRLRVEAVLYQSEHEGAADRWSPSIVCGAAMG